MKLRTMTPDEKAYHILHPIRGIFRETPAPEVPPTEEPADDATVPVEMTPELKAKLDAILDQNATILADQAKLTDQLNDLAGKQAAGDDTVAAEVEKLRADMATKDASLLNNTKAIAVLQQMTNRKQAVLPFTTEGGADTEEQKSPGERMACKNFMAGIATGGAKNARLEMKTGFGAHFARANRRKAEFSGIDAASAAALSGFTSYRWPEVVTPPDVTYRMRDVLNVQPVTSDTVDYIEETGFYAWTTQLTVAAAPGANTLTVSNANGSHAGQTITLTEGANTQDVEVLSIAVADDGEAGVITLTAVITGSYTYTTSADVTAPTFTFTPDTNVKPLAEIQYEAKDCTIRTLATTLPIPKRFLEDFPILRNRIDNRLMYGLERSETHQIFYGSGTGNDLEGILVNSSIQTFLWSNGDPNDTQADAVLNAITLASLSGYTPNAIVLHPTDLSKIRKLKGSDGHYLVTTAFDEGNVLKLWGVPIVSTQAILQGTALVGDFNLGATLWDREQSRVDISLEHADFFTRNMAMLRAEERICMTVELPEAFVKVTFDSAPVDPSA